MAISCVPDSIALVLAAIPSIADLRFSNGAIEIAAQLFERWAECPIDPMRQVLVGKMREAGGDLIDSENAFRHVDRDLTIFVTRLFKSKIGL